MEILSESELDALVNVTVLSIENGKGMFVIFGIDRFLCSRSGNNILKGMNPNL